MLATQHNELIKNQSLKLHSLVRVRETFFVFEKRQSGVLLTATKIQTD